MWSCWLRVEPSATGSRLASPKILDLLCASRPYRLTVSVYGASEQTYDAVTRRRGSFRAFSRGLAAAHEAGLPLNLNIIVVKQNAHEITQMTAMMPTACGDSLCSTCRNVG